MLAKIVKWVSVAASLLALLWPSSAGYRTLLAGLRSVRDLFWPSRRAAQSSAGAGMTYHLPQHEILHLKGRLNEF